MDSTVIDSEGVAIINYDPYAVGKETGQRKPKTGAFYDMYGSDSTTGLLVAWGWGVSRIIEVSIDCGNRFLIKPGAPQESAFYRAQNGLCGEKIPRMPLGCVDNCTPPEYLEGIRQWIANGALQP